MAVGGDEIFFLDTARRPVLRRTVVTLALVVVVMGILGIAAAWVHSHPELAGTFPGDKILQQQFLLDGENNIPTWFSSALMAFAAGLSALVAASQRGAGWERRGWLALGVVLLVLSVDETASLHETFSSTIQDGLGTEGLLHFGWLVAAIPMVLILGALFLRFVLRLDPGVRRWVVAAGVVYLLGAVAFEMVGGVIWETSGPDSWAYGLGTTVEELLEMSGLVILVYSLTRQIELSIRYVGIAPRD
jgi:hypothetical protein